MGKLTTATLSLAGVTVVCAGAIVICLQSGSRPRPRPRPRPEEDSDSDRPSPKPKPYNNNDDRRPSLAESVTSVVSDAFDASARIMVELGTGKRTTAKRRGSTSSVESVRTWRKSGKSKQQKNEPWARFIINEFHACLLGTDMRLLVEKHVLKECRVLYDKEGCCATLRAVKFAYDNQDVRVPQFKFLRYAQAPRGVRINECKAFGDYRKTMQRLQAYGSTWKFQLDLPVDVDLKVDYNIPYMPRGSVDVSIRNLHVRGEISVYFEENLGAAIVHFAQAPRVKLCKVRAAVKSNSMAVAGAAKVAGAAAGAAAGPKKIKNWITDAIRQQIDSHLDPFVDGQAVRIPLRDVQALADLGSSRLVKTQTANPHKHVQVTLQRPGQHTALSSGSSDTHWNAWLRQLMKDWFLSAPLCRWHAKLIIDTCNPIMNTKQMLLELRNTNGSYDGLTIRPLMVEGEVWVPGLKFCGYSKPNSTKDWVYTEGTKKRKLNGQDCSIWKFDWAVPVEIDVILDFKFGAKKGQRIPGSVRASVTNLRTTGKVYVWMQPDLGSVVISLLKPKVTWDFTVQVGTRNHATIVAGQAAAAGVTVGLGDNVVGDVVGAGVGVVVGVGAGMAAPVLVGGAGVINAVGKVFKGLAGKKKQAAKEVKAQSTEFINEKINSAVNKFVDDQLKELTYPNAKKFDIMGESWVAKKLEEMDGHAPKPGDRTYSAGDLARAHTTNFKMMEFSDSD